MTKSGRMEELMAVRERVRINAARLVRLQRRVWLAETLLGPALGAVAVLATAATVWRLSRRRPVVTVELPELTPGPRDTERGADGRAVGAGRAHDPGSRTDGPPDTSM